MYLFHYFFNSKYSVHILIHTYILNDIQLFQMDQARFRKSSKESNPDTIKIIEAESEKVYFFKTGTVEKTKNYKSRTHNHIGNQLITG